MFNEAAILITGGTESFGKQYVKTSFARRCKLAQLFRSFQRRPEARARRVAARAARWGLGVY
jgi:hypothetical protein